MPVASGTVALWNLDNALTDSSGNGYTLSQTGTVPFVTSPTPAQGTHAAGVFSGAQYAYSAGVRTALSGSTTFTIEAGIYLSALSGTEKQFIGAGSGGDALDFVITTTGRVKYVTDNANVYQSAAGVITTGSWFYVAAVLNGTNLKLWAVAYGGTPVSVVDTTATSPAFPTVGNLNVGTGSAVGFGPLDSGYLDAIRISNVARTSLPTTDTTGSVWTPARLRRRRR